MLARSWKTIIGIFAVAILVVTLFQNCARVGLSSRGIQSAIKNTNTVFACTEATRVCEINGQQGTMTCTSGVDNEIWGECIVPGVPPTTPLAGCTFKDVSFSHGQSFTAYEQTTVAASAICKSELRTCLNGAITGSYQFLTCSNDSGACNLGGVTVQHNQTIEAFETASVPYGQACKKQIRRCSDGALDGAYSFLSCVADGPVGCAFNGQTVAHLNEVLAYESANVSYGGECKSQKRACNNGTLSGTYAAATCMVSAPAACMFNNTSVPHGGSVPAYQASSVPFGSTCKLESRLCSNGQLGGTYGFGSCEVSGAQTCTFNGSTVAHTGTVTAYQTSVVPFGSVCASEVRTCSNGTLNGSYLSPACTVAPAASCSFNNQNIAHNGSVVTYSSPTVPYGSTCSSVAETRVCRNGTLDGSSPYTTCATAPPQTCAFNGQSVAHGGSVQSYYSATATDPEVCRAETRTCDNGNLSGSYGYPGCSVVVPATPTCNVYYQARNDSKISPIGTNGAWALFHSDANKDCNDYPGCGIRMGIACVGEAQLRLKYQFKSISIDSTEMTTPWSGVDGAIQWGEWSLVYQPNQPSSECKSPLQCGIKVMAETLNGKPCSISYNYKVDKSNYSPVAGNGAWSVLSRSSNQGDNCDDDNCGMQARLSCQAGGTYNPPAGGGGGGGRFHDNQLVNNSADQKATDERAPASANPTPEVSLWDRISSWFANAWTSVFGN